MTGPSVKEAPCVRGLLRAAWAVVGFLVATAQTLEAATYLPMPDADLASRAPVVVHVRAGESAGRLGAPGRGPAIVTLTDLELIEVLKGKVSTSTIRLALPGGVVGSEALWIPGRPELVPGQEAVLFLAPIPGRPDEYGTTELGLSVFDVLEDPSERRFAVRSQFQSGEEEVLAPDGTGPGEPDHVRDLESFLAALRVAGRGEPLPEVTRTAPAGPMRLAVGPAGGTRALWVNVGGREGTGNQFKWFWTSGTGCISPNGVVRPVGTQSNLTDGSNGLAHVQNAVSQWAGVAGATVRYSYSASGGNVSVNLDVDDDPYTGWISPMECSLGVLGVAGPSSNCAGSFPPVSGTVYATNSGGVWMRRSTCASGYTSAVFRSAVLHEVGHTLGLGHPDQAQSTFSTTTSAQWSSAVMRSSVPPGRPDTPQADDVAGVQFYYGTAGPPAPVASFTFAPASPRAGQTVTFTDTSTNAPTSWLWEFGDGFTSSVRNPVHAFSAAGTYGVTLTATSAGGSGTKTNTVTVSSGGPPVAAFTFSPELPAAGQVVAFSDRSTNAPTSWSWTFGDGTTSSSANPLKSFAVAGTYTVTLQVSNPSGSSTTSKAVVVGPSEAERIVPIVLDAFGVGGSRFRSELVVANRGTTAATVELTYTAATALAASGSGSVTETLGAGRQLVLDDALAWLRSRGLAVPQAAAGASQGGTLRLRFRGLSSSDAGEAFARTTALLPDGRAGVAYPAVTPADWSSPAGLHVFGLRENAEARSNLALVNLSSTEDVGLRVTLTSGEMGDRSSMVLPETVVLKPLQWTQLGAVLGRAGYANGWVRVDRVSGGGPYYAYGVFNDHGTNDGSFIDPVPVAAGESSRMVPVVLELGIYDSELILTNPTEGRLDYTLAYVESYAAPGVARREGGNFLQPREQRIVDAIPHLRALAVDVGPPGGSWAGAVLARFTTGGEPAPGFAGARTRSPGQPQGSYGVFYAGLGSGQTAASEAWVYGLRQDGEARSNVAVAHAEPGGAPIVLQAQVFDGESGAAVGGTANVALNAGQWFQWNQLLSGFGLRQGYVRVVRISGSSRFLAYAVVNDGGTSRPGTNDGSYVPMVSGK